MLSELFIENLAVIEKTDVQFGEGLNVFTGETGAGKSILIDAINAVLGQRTSREIVRHGTGKASVTARFSAVSGKALQKLCECGYEAEEGELVVTREIFADSKSTARLNGKPVNIGILREIGAELVNIHGQHDNQILLAPDRHIEILDEYGDFSPLLEEYRSCYKDVLRIKRELKKVSMDEQEKAHRIDLLSYQIKELSEAELHPGEDAELEATRSEIRNAAAIVDGYRAAYVALNGEDGEGGAVDLTHIAVGKLEEVSDFYESAGELYSALDGVSAELDELSGRLLDALEAFDFNPARLERVETRLDEVKTLKRKYGGTIEEALAYLEKAQAELAELNLSDQKIRELNEQGTAAYTRLLELADQVTAARQAAGERFVKCVTEELTFLDMPSVRLEVRLEQVIPNSKGRDAVEFLISTNVGEPPKPIAKIASGGELSRIMLAIKNTLADRDEVPTLIFDEIDVGISGHAAQKVGLKLKQAATHRQIFTVTHLAQIAALGDSHYLIKKEDDGERTFTNVTCLNQQGRVREVARIMSTDNITELMLQNAADMIEKGRR